MIKNIFDQKRIIIFDFDGTLADSIGLGYRVLNELAPRYGYKLIMEEDMPRLRGMTPRQLMKEFKVSIFKVPFLARRVQKYTSRYVDEIQLFPQIPALITALAERGYTLGIITSNSYENVKYVLEKNHLFHFFHFIHAERSLFGKHRAFRKLIKEFGFLKKEMLYVADEVRDIEACKKARIQIASATWGFNTRQILQDYHPEILLDTPEQLIRVLPANALASI